MRKDNRQKGFGFGDFELFADESAAMVNPVEGPNVRVGCADLDLFDDDEPKTEPCRPEGCEHSDEEHRAFDAGVRAGELDVDVFDNPYKESSLVEAWLSGHSVGAMNQEVI